MDGQGKQHQCDSKYIFHGHEYNAIASFVAMTLNIIMDIKRWNKQDNIFEGVLDTVYKNIDTCHVYYVEDKGFAVLNLEPSYGIYKRIEIAEIQDVFILPECRRQGVASTLIKYCEDQVTSDMVGISVPVSPQYGAAQRLYYKLGYEPDGNGVTYDREAVEHGAHVTLNERLCLMMVKRLEANQG